MMVRRGWPLVYIPAGKNNWAAFLREATDEQLEQTCLVMAYDALLSGQVELAREGLRAILEARVRRAEVGEP